MGTGTYATASKPTTLNMEKMLEAMEKIRDISTPNFDMIVGHPSKLSENLGATGLHVVKNDLMLDRVHTRKPRTKKKRIQKKALKLYGKEVPSNNAYLIDTRKFFDFSKMWQIRPTW